jgi:hypothetical protein
MIKVWVLTIAMVNGSVEYGYKFAFRETCMKVGKQYSQLLKIKTMPSCRLKNVTVSKNNGGL